MINRLMIARSTCRSHQGRSGLLVLEDGPYDEEYFDPGLGFPGGRDYLDSFQYCSRAFQSLAVYY